MPDLDVIHAKLSSFVPSAVEKDAEAVKFVRTQLPNSVVSALDFKTQGDRDVIRVQGFLQSIVRFASSWLAQPSVPLNPDVRQRGRKLNALFR